MADVVVVKFVGDRCRPWLLETLWKVGAMPSSTHFAQTEVEAQFVEP
jgi:hypothetical protein